MKMEMPKKETYATSPTEVGKMLINILKKEDVVDQNKEHLFVIGLGGDQIVEFIELVTLGLIDQTLSHPRETFRTAVREGTTSIILAHNHPSTSKKKPEPSDADINQTEKMFTAGRILGIPVVDHLIVNVKSPEVYSMAFDRGNNKLRSIFKSRPSKYNNA